jgi:hypothetical protein
MERVRPDDAWDAGNLACGPMLLAAAGQLLRDRQVSGQSPPAV